jgi:nitrite reductase (NADH) small subunit
MTTILRGNEWTSQVVDLGPAARIPIGEGRKYRLGNEEVAIFRTRTGDIYAVQAECPHRSGPIADGLTGEGRVVCPLHGFAFDLATGEAVNGSCGGLRTYPVEADDTGNILLTFSSEPREALRKAG